MFNETRGIDIGPVSISTRFFHYSFSIMNLDLSILAGKNRGKKWFAFHRCKNYLVFCFLKMSVVVEHAYVTTENFENLKVGIKAQLLEEL